MLILEINRLKKYYGDRLLLDIDRLKLYTGDRIGLVGLNGSGKTTLMNIIAGAVQADEGSIISHGVISYIEQLDEEDLSTLSGGEKTLGKVRAALSEGSHFLLADEPTSSLSMGHVRRLTDELRNAEHGFMLVSHDKTFLNALCNKIIEIDNGKIKEYQGDYDFYRQARMLEDRQEHERYEAYASESRRLADRVAQLKNKAGKMNKAPKRMGNSEARLHKNSVKAKAGKVDQAARIIEGRLALLEEVKKPVEEQRTKIEIHESSKLYSKIAVECSGLSKAFDGTELFRDAGFRIPTGSKTALIGENGTGKTTLARMIISGAPGIQKAAALKIAYFAQGLEILDTSKTVLENVSESSAFSRTLIRSILSRMLFYRDDVYKPVGVLSGGERVKVALCKIFAWNVNMLVLDEPSNYLDVYSMEALEALIRDFEGTLLLITHDGGIVQTADRLLVLEDKTIKTYEGTYQEYLLEKDRVVRPSSDNELLQLNNRLATVIGRLSNPSKTDDIEELDREFKLLAEKIREIRERQ